MVFTNKYYEYIMNTRMIYDTFKYNVLVPRIIYEV